MKLNISDFTSANRISRRRGFCCNSLLGKGIQEGLVLHTYSEPLVNRKGLLKVPNNISRYRHMVLSVEAHSEVSKIPNEYIINK